MISNDMNKWMDYEGKEFFKDIGIRENYLVLDFGCGHGTYTIPASLVVGEKGMIYAADKKQEALNELTLKAKEKNLKNIEIIEPVDKINLPLSDKSIDVVLLYDVLHLVESRTRLLIEIYRVLKSNGILSVYPKHHQTHMNMSLEEVIKEIKSVGFIFSVKNFKRLMHDNKLEKGFIINFKKV